MVKTLLDLVLVILLHRNRNNGLLLSELGDHLLGGARGPAGVKRIASLLHSAKWKSSLILKYLWGRANQKVEELSSRQSGVYVIWDESVLEKPVITSYSIHYTKLYEPRLLRGRAPQRQSGL